MRVFRRLFGAKRALGGGIEGDQQRQRSEEEERRHREHVEEMKRARRWAFGGVVFVAVVGAAVAIYVAERDGESETQNPTGSTPADESKEPLPAPPKPLNAYDIGLGCPVEPLRGRPRSVRIRVIAWCATAGVRGQAMLKFKVHVENIGRGPIGIGRERFALVVTKLRPEAWSPPQIGEPTPDAPRRVRYRGHRVWAIPANADGAYDEVEGPGLTFATHWGGDSLASGERFSPSLTDKARGVLVFYLPVSSRRVTLRGIVGVGFVDESEIIALCPPGRWGDRLAATEF